MYHFRGLFDCTRCFCSCHNARRNTLQYTILLDFIDFTYFRKTDDLDGLDEHVSFRSCKLDQITHALSCPSVEYRKAPDSVVKGINRSRMTMRTPCLQPRLQYRYMVSRPAVQGFYSFWDSMSKPIVLLVFSRSLVALGLRWDDAQGMKSRDPSWGWSEFKNNRMIIDRLYPCSTQTITWLVITWPRNT